MAYTVFAFSFTIQVDNVLGGESARKLGEREGHAERTLHQLLGLKEALQVPHLPDTSEDEDDCLSDGPPQDPLVGTLTGQTKALFTIPLVILLLLDLFHLIKQLASSELQLRQFVLGSNLRVVVGMLSNLDV